jgi:hypothetical protein
MNIAAQIAVMFLKNYNRLGLIIPYWNVLNVILLNLIVFFLHLLPRVPAYPVVVPADHPVIVVAAVLPEPANTEQVFCKNIMSSQMSQHFNSLAGNIC